MARYEIMENGTAFETITADTADQALANVETPSPADYGSPTATMWVEWHAVNIDDPDDRSSVSYQLDPIEPECEPDHSHNWQDHDPVRGSGAGVKYSDRCPHCGAVRWTDTWATRPDNGTRGHTVISYMAD